MEANACFITGHRPQRFKFKYNEDYKLCIKIKKTLRAEFIRHYTEKGIRRFWVGGAVGVDCWAAEIILGLCKQDAYRDMELCVALPFPEYNEKYDAKQKARWRDILRGCTDSVVVCPAFQPDAYKKRNYYMADCCSCGIAIYDNDRAIRSGTGMTVNYAQRKSVKLTFIHPDTARADVP